MNWTEIPFKEFVTLQRGFDLPKSHMVDGVVPVLGSNCVIGYHNEMKVEAPGVVTGRSGTLGLVQYSEQPFWPHNTALWVKDFKGNNPKFVYYKLKTLHLERFNGGASVPTLNRNVLDTLPVRIPEPAEQTRITSILSAYDDLIENNRRRIQLLEQAARLLYKEWFVHLRFPGHERIKIKDGVPEGWRKKTFGEVAENFDRFRVPLSVLERENRVGPYPYHGAAGILGYIDDFLFDGRFLLIGEDGTVFTRSGSAMLQFVEGKFWVSNHAHVVRGNSVSTEFLYCFMSHYSIQPHVTGVAQPKLSQKNLNRIEMLVPSTELNTLFSDVMEPLFQQAFKLKSQIDTIAKARDLLLPRLMNGQVAA